MHYHSLGAYCCDLILFILFSAATLPSIPQGFAMANDVQFAKVSRCFGVRWHRTPGRVTCGTSSLLPHAFLYSRFMETSLKFPYNLTNCIHQLASSCGRLQLMYVYMAFHSTTKASFYTKIYMKVSQWSCQTVCTHNSQTFTLC